MAIAGVAYLKRSTAVSDVRRGDDLLRYWFDYNAVLATSRRNLKFSALKVIHMTSPFDNATGFIIDNLHGVSTPLVSPITFQWDPLSGAAYYKIILSEWNDAGWVRGIDNPTIVTTTQVIRSLPPPQSPTGWYWFDVLAYDASDRWIGEDVYQPVNSGWPWYSLGLQAQ
jgi:hypothetical protein